MHSEGSDQTTNILVYIQTHHSALHKKEKMVDNSRNINLNYNNAAVLER